VWFGLVSKYLICWRLLLGLFLRSPLHHATMKRLSKFFHAASEELVGEACLGCFWLLVLSAAHVSQGVDAFAVHMHTQSSVKWKQATLEVSRHSLRASVTAVLAASASMVAQSCTGPKDADYAALRAAVANM